MRYSRFGMVLAVLAVLMLEALPPALGTGAPRTHLDWASLMVREVRPENTSYQHKQGHVSWKGIDGATQYESHTDCSGFLNALFERAYGFDKQYYQRWLGKGRPYAITYHDAIASQHGFTRVDRVGDVRPGDIIAIQYPDGSENTGHIMLVAERPAPRPPSKPVITGTEQWEITIIDSSNSGHGKTDTRRKDDGTFSSGVGEGVFRLYTGRDGRIAGYTWSTLGASDFYDQDTRNLVIGRLDPRFKP